MPKNQITETVPFNFNDLYAGLETKFKTAGYDTAQGSNASQLVTAMTYLTSMLNVNTSVNINESILSLATTRNSALTDARALGYEIQHMQSYTYRLTLTLTGGINGTYTIPKYTKFTEGAKTYYYMGSQIELTNRPDGSTVEILVVEGILYQYGDHAGTLSITTSNTINDAGVSVPQYYIDIPFADVEENGIECYITYYDDFGTLITNEQWLKSKEFMLDRETTVFNKFFRMDDIKLLTPRIYFELSGVGNGVRIGTIVNLNILQTSGVLGAMVDPNTPAGISHILSNITVSNAVLVTEGTNEETLESIKLNAPKFYNSANRAVIANDYQAIINRQTSVNDSYVWGGNEELPKSPGHIWFSFQPSTTQRVYTSDEFNQQYLLNDNIFTNWDYTAVPSGDPVLNPGLFESQLVLANTYYSIRFIEDSEIRSVATTSTGQLIQPGIWDVLDNFKIPTLEYHNRHPVYVHFEYDVEILKYNVITSKADIHSTVFNVIDGFFTGVNDTFKAEKFNVQYFHSSLEKRIDSYLTDESGYNNTVTAKLLLTQKNVSVENVSTDFRDIYVPLSIPYEPYFDANGYLLYNVLPSIDTNEFIDYRGLVNGLPTGAIPANKMNTSNIYTDWSGVQSEITASGTQINQELIIAPIKSTITETSAAAVGGETSITLTKIEIYPDDPSTLDVGTPLYTKTTVTHITGGVSTVLAMGTDWSYNIVNPEIVNLNAALVANDTIRVDREAVCGQYILFNGRKKYITVQLYVDATGYVQGQSSAVSYNTPKSYLTTLDQLYDFTIDGHYLTTSGYSLTNANQVAAITGPIVKYVSTKLYSGSPIKMTLLRRDRYLNLNYNSPNFTMDRNLVPMLKRVTFK